jgi:hypothetical protein
MDIGSVVMGVAIVAIFGFVIKGLFFPKKEAPYTGGGTGGGSVGGGTGDGSTGGKGDHPEPQ